MLLPYGILKDHNNHISKREKLFMYVIEKTIGGYRKSGEAYKFCVEWPDNDEVADELGIKTSSRIYTLKKEVVRKYRLIEWKVDGQLWVAPNPALLSGENLKKTYFETKKKWVPNGYLRITINGEVFDSSKRKKKAKPVEAKMDELASKDDSTKDIVYPDWLDKDLWADWKEYKKGLKMPLSGLSEKLAIKQLESLIDEGQDQTDVIETAIARGWKALFVVKKLTQDEMDKPALPKLIVEGITRKRPKEK